MWVDQHRELDMEGMSGKMVVVQLVQMLQLVVLLLGLVLYNHKLGLDLDYMMHPSLSLLQLPLLLLPLLLVRWKH